MSETLDKLYLEWSQFTKARNNRELVMLTALRAADAAINPSDRSGISLETWNVRLKAATAKIRAAIAKAEKHD
jgi:hypothetical protein